MEETENNTSSLAMFPQYQLHPRSRRKTLQGKECVVVERHKGHFLSYLQRPGYDF